MNMPTSVSMHVFTMLGLSVSWAPLPFNHRRLCLVAVIIISIPRVHCTSVRSAVIKNVEGAAPIWGIGGVPAGSFRQHRTPIKGSVAAAAFDTCTGLGIVAVCVVSLESGGRT